MKRGLRTGGLALAVAVLVGVAQADAQLRVGVSAPLSGPDAVFGAQLQIGVEQAVADLDAAGGLLGERVSVIPADDHNDASRAAEVARTFIRGGVAFVVGPFGSAAALSASAVYGAAGVLEALPAATAPTLTQRGLATLFRLGSRDDRQAQVAARFLMAQHETKIAIVHDQTAAAKALADTVRNALADGGVRDVVSSTFSDEKDLAPLAARLRASGAKVVFWSGAPGEAGSLLRQLRAAGSTITVMGGVALAADDFAAAAGSAAEGTLIVFPPDPRQRPEAADLLRRLRAKGVDPGAYAFYAYAAVQVMGQAAALAKSVDPQAVAAVIHRGTAFKTVVGEVVFDPDGERTPPDYTVLTWRRGPTGRLAF